MRRFSMLLLAATAVGWPITSQAGDREVAAGIIGGLAAGALIGGGAAAAQQDVAPDPVYVAPPPAQHCYWTHGERTWDEYRGAWIRPRFQVCNPADEVVDDEVVGEEW
jgi:hypothetical protein